MKTRKRQVKTRAASGTCAACANFLSDGDEFERMFPGIPALGSGHGDSKGGQGICTLNQAMVYPSMRCRHYSPAPARGE